MITVLSSQTRKLIQQFNASRLATLGFTISLLWSAPTIASPTINGITNGLVAYYPFDGDANDATGNGYNGTPQSVNAIADRFGQANKAYTFNGASSIISFSRVPLQQPDNWTITAWATLSTLNQNGIIVSMGMDNNSATSDGFSFGFQANSHSFLGLFSGVNWIDSGYVFTAPNQWHQLAMLRTNGITRFYVDGVQTANASSLTPRTPSLFQIGAQAAASRFFSGGIDDVRIYNRALTSDEVLEEFALENTTAPLAIFQQPASATLLAGTSTTLKVGAAGDAPFNYQWSFNGTTLVDATNATLSLANLATNDAGTYAVMVSNASGSVLSSNAVIAVLPPLAANLTNSLVAYYPFSGDATDAAASGINGIPQNTHFVADRFGYPNSAYAFNGTSSLISFNAAPLHQIDSWSISAWVQIYSTNQDAVILSMGSDNGSIADGFSFGMRNSGNNEGTGNRLSGLFGGVGWIDSGYQFESTNLWHHFVMVRSSGITKFFVDGVQTATSSSLTPYLPSSFQIGGEKAGRFFNGAIDDVRIYSRALSPQDVSSLFTGEIANVAPAITRQPSSLTLALGVSGTLNVGVYGGQPLTYQWMFNGTNLLNETNATLTLRAVTTDTAGMYSVLVANSGGSALSSNINVTVLDALGDGAPTNGLVAYYLFDGNASDASGHGFDGQPQSTQVASDRFGHSNSAYSFDGVSSYIGFNSVPLQQIDNWTMSAWVKLHSVNQRAVVLSMGADDGSGANGFSLGFINSAGSNMLYGLFGGVSWIDAGYQFATPDQWHQVIMLRDTGVTKFYVDGVQTAKTWSLVPTMPTRFQIGGQDGAGRYFNGVIDDVRIYNRALTPAEIDTLLSVEEVNLPPSITQQPSSQTLIAGSTAAFNVVASGNSGLKYQWMLNGTNLVNETDATLTISSVSASNAGTYSVNVFNGRGFSLSSNATLTVITPSSGDLSKNLVAYYPFDGNAVDASGNGYNGVAQSTFGAVDRFGNVNSALAFNGTSSYVNFNSVPLQQTDNWTISAWVALYTTNQYSAIVAMGADSGVSAADGFSFAMTSDAYHPGNGLFGLFGGVIWIDTNYRFTMTNQWHHITMLRTNGTTKFYVNGLETASTSAYTPRQPTSFQIGAQPGASRYFNGAIDDVRIYNRALAPEEVTALFTMPDTPSALTIVLQPAPTTLMAGFSANFKVGAKGLQPFNYQWMLDGTNLPGATNATLMISSATDADAGNYSVSVSNSGESVVSSNALLRVLPALASGDPTNGLVAYYPFNGEASDVTGSGYDGKPKNATLIPDRFGHPDSAYAFNGTSSYIDFNSVPLQQVDNWTMSAWVNLYSTNQMAAIVSMGADNGSAVNGFAMGIRNPGYEPGPGNNFDGLFSGIGWGESGYQFTTSNQWHQLIMLRTNGTTQFYVDGVQTANTSALAPRVPTLFQIGAQPGAGRYFDGGIDDVRLYNRALTANEVAALFAIENSAIPLTILRQPASKILLLGAPATLNVGVLGTPPFTYQWLFNGTNLPDATNATLTLSAVTTNMAGSYSVLVANSAGSVLSSNANVTVTDELGGGALTNGLVAYYPFDGSALDASGNGYNGVAQSTTGVDDRFGNANSAFAFNGTSSYVNFNSVPLQQTDNWTISAWVALYTTNQYSAIVAMGADSGSAADGFSFAMTSDAYHPGNGLFGLLGGVKWIDTNYRFTVTNEWHHITMLRTNGTLKFYVDGLETAKTSAYTPRPPTSFQIGAQPGTSRYFNGAIDDVRIYNRALTPDEVSVLFAIKNSDVPLTISRQPASATLLPGTSATLDVGVVGAPPFAYQWQFNGTNLINATDSSLSLSNVTTNDSGAYAVLVANGRDSVLSSTAMLTVLPPLAGDNATNGLVAYYPFNGDATDATGHGYNGLPHSAQSVTDRFGHSGSAFGFNGQSSYISFNSVPLQQTDNWTMSAWVKPYGINQLGIVVSMGADNNGSTGNGFSFLLSDAGAGKGNSFFGLFSGIDWIDSGYVTADTNYWHQLVMLRTNGTTQFYFDGMQTANTSSLTPRMPTLFQIGAQPSAGARYFYGAIDDVRIYSRALSAQEISDTFTAEEQQIPPTIVQQPSSATVAAGVSAHLGVSAFGGQPLTYQWIFNGTNLPGATDAMLVIHSATASNAGDYSVRLSNPVGSVVSSVAHLAIGPAFPSGDITNGLVAYYPFGGDASDVTGHGYNGVPQSAQLTTDRFGHANSAYQFDGSDSYINFDSVPLQQTDNWTMSAWVNLSTTNQLGIIVSMGADGGYAADGFSFGIMNKDYITDADNDLIGLFSGNGWDDSGYRFTASNQWHQIVMLRTNGLTQFYVDGRQTAQTSSIEPSMPSQFFIGAQPEAGRFFDGAIDDVRIYNRALTRGEVGSLFALEDKNVVPTIVQQPSSMTLVPGASAVFSVDALGGQPLKYQWHFNGKNLAAATKSSLTIHPVAKTNAGNYSVTVSNGAGSVTSATATLSLAAPFAKGDPTNGLVALYSFNGDASDVTGHGFNGVSHGTQLVVDRSGHPNAAFEFDGTNSYVSFDAVPLQQIDNWTMSAWVNPYSFEQLGIILSMGTDNDDFLADGFSFGTASFDAYQKISFFGLFNGVSWLDSGYLFPNAHEWHQVVMLRTNGITKFYVDGVQTANAYGETPLMPSLFTIGAQPAANRYFYGAIDDVRIYNRAITPTEIATLFSIETANTSPAIVRQPDPAIAFIGSTSTFSVIASGGEPLHYQWRLNGTKLVNATNATFVVKNPALKNAGDYSVLVSNAEGSVLSSNATLIVVDPSTFNMTNGLVAYYPFNGNANDASGYGNNGSPQGAELAADRFGRFDNAYEFDGTSSYIGFDSVPLQQTDNWTMSAWINAYGFNDYQMIVSMGADDNAYTADGFSFGFSGNWLEGLFNGVEWVDTGYQSMPMNEWHQVVMLRDQSVTRFYVDGVPTSNFTYDTPLMPSLFHIGGQPDGAGRYFFGAIDDVRIYNRALSPLEVGLLFTLESKKPTPAFLLQGGAHLATLPLNGTNFGSPKVLQTPNPGVGWRAVATADLDNDGKRDVLLQSSKGYLKVWLMNGAKYLRSVNLNQGQPVDTQWKAVGMADFNRDGHQDLLFQNSTGNLSVWLMNGTDVISQKTVANNMSMGNGWHVAGVAEMNNDGHEDIIWQNQSGYVAIWLMNGTDLQSSVTFNSNSIRAGWTLVGIEDVNGDGQKDLLWQRVDGHLCALLMNGPRPKGPVVTYRTPVLPTWRIVGGF